VHSDKREKGTVFRTVMKKASCSAVRKKKELESRIADLRGGSTKKKPEGKPPSVNFRKPILTPLDLKEEIGAAARKALTLCRKSTYISHSGEKEGLGVLTSSRRENTDCTDRGVQGEKGNDALITVSNEGYHSPIFLIGTAVRLQS